MEAAASLRSTLLRNAIASIEKEPITPDRAASVAQLCTGSGLLAAGPDGMLGGPWSSVTELQNKFIEQLLKHIAKSEVIKICVWSSAEKVKRRLVCSVPRLSFVGSGNYAQLPSQAFPLAWAILPVHAHVTPALTLHSPLT